VTHHPGSTSALRRANTVRVLSLVHQSGGLVQAEIARRSGLSPATVTNLVRDLVAEGAVAVSDCTVNGRRARMVSPAVSPGYVLGVDLGRSHVRMMLADQGHQVLGESYHPLDPGLSAVDGLALVARLYEELLGQAGADRGQVLHAGVGLPGPLDVETQQIGAGTLLPEWTGQDLRAAFAETLGLDVTVDNDANLGALGEYAWPVPDDPTAASAPPPGWHQSLVYVRLATGIGGGLVLDGELFRGANGTAGEVGHQTISENGPLCRCGNRGCLEAIASIPHFLGALRSALDREVDVAAWVDLAKGGHTIAVRLVQDLGQHVGAALANLTNLVNPHRIVIGGPISATEEILLAPIRAEIRRRAIPAASRHVRVERTRHGDYAEVLGATHLALTTVRRQVGFNI
jgi:predicted NBD/HSP70 family sugar kinase